MKPGQHKRQDMLDKGLQVDISEFVKQGGLLIPAYASKKLWDTVIKLDASSDELNSEETKRMSEVIYKLIYYIRTHRQTSRSNIINFSVSLTSDGTEQNFDIVSDLNIVDRDNPAPCITLMMSDEMQEH